MIANLKKEIRKRLLKKRNGLSPDGNAELSRLICEFICQMPEYKASDTVLLYASTRGEPDFSQIAKNAFVQNKCVAYPISRVDSCTLDFRKISSLDELNAGAYGILEPSDTAQVARLTEKTLCIVPALSTDKNGFRIGYGKGYYDRFLSSFPGISICALWSELISDELVHDENDVPVDIIITETGVVHHK